MTASVTASVTVAEPDLCCCPTATVAREPRARAVATVNATATVNDARLVDEPFSNSNRFQRGIRNIQRYMASSGGSATSSRELGNALFKKKEYEAALCEYTSALELGSLDATE